MELEKTQLRSESLSGTHDITIVKTRRGQFSTYCARCRQYVATFTTDEIKGWLRSIENGEAHLIEPGQGSLVCRNSLK